ncbi:uncharacterized protein LOC126777489 [Nymphalis io]|uniref:uncharacterized protein LOC126777489 n=1 Tax=Inachis io TaxID=171585 RepID=UPI00216A2D67|nr:uncharacterized protein LOC126777489 [Nymphalis io]
MYMFQGSMGGIGVGALGGAGGVLAAEVCAPLLLLCWLCCWPDDDRSDSSSEKYPQKPVISNESNSRQRSNELFARRFGSSAVSLHTPSTSGHTKQPLSSHRSHEEIRCRRKSHLEPADPDARYHSAPSVIDEVIHRRDWERSTKDLYIPLKSDNEFSNASDVSDISDKEESLEETTDKVVVRTCKKHYKNIKSSRKKDLNKESLNDDIKDQDATESVTNFYIGDATDTTSPNENTNEIKADDKVKKPYKAKEAKQCLNESIRSKDIGRNRQPLVPLTEFQVAGFELHDIDDVELDRSGAMHHTVESRSSSYNTHTIPAPPPSVEAVGYEWEASYMEESGAAGVWRAPGAGWARARHASAGDVLAPARRPQSGALSESDLDFELEGCDDPPPAYDEVELLASLDRKETAI